MLPFAESLSAFVAALVAPALVGLTIIAAVTKVAGYRYLAIVTPTRLDVQRLSRAERR